MDWRDIPSLAALRAFEAAARLDSFSAAARELNVTHAAIAQHVRALEDHFSQSLMERDGRAMRPTPAGRQLAYELGQGFGQIGDAVRTLLDDRRQRPVQVSTTHSFAETWLMPRIAEFWAKHPDVEIALIPSIGLVDLRRDGFDLAIRFGDGNWPGLDKEPLVMSPFVLVGAPALVQGRTLAELGPVEGFKWILSQESREHTVWGAAAGLDMAQLNISTMSNNGLAMAAVRAGHGLSVQAKTLVQDDLESGRLQALYEGDPVGLGYYLVTQRGPMSPALTTFVKWLRRAAQ